MNFSFVLLESFQLVSMLICNENGSIYKKRYLLQFILRPIEFKRNADRLMGQNGLWPLEVPRSFREPQDHKKWKKKTIFLQAFTGNWNFGKSMQPRSPFSIVYRSKCIISDYPKAVNILFYGSLKHFRPCPNTVERIRHYL